MREALGGASFADVAITTFFGFDPDFNGSKLIVDPGTARSFRGTLRGVRYHGKDYNLNAGADGITINKQ